MKVNEITVTYKRTIQMRQFEPAEIGVTIKVQIDPTDLVGNVLTETRKAARIEVEKERNRLLEERMESIHNEKEKSI